ncbi:MAG TPA: hypothetical protein PLX90_11130 [Anaerolineales bacterium]|nr:hypothetical protein [Anaerolineales bacterium]
MTKTVPKYGNRFSFYYQVGADELITKPVNPMAVLIKVITRLARQKWITPRKEIVQMNV